MKTSPSDHANTGTGGSRAVLSSDAGMVTAETAVVLPLLAGVALCLCWVLSLGIAQVRLVDSARDGARALSRGETEAVAVATARRAAPDGATVDISTGAGQVTVTVRFRTEAPGGFLGRLPRVTLQAASTLPEETIRAGE